MRPVLLVVFAAAVLSFASSACHEEFTAPEQPDLAKVKEKFEVDLSGFVPEGDLSVDTSPDLARDEHDLAHHDG